MVIVLFVYDLHVCGSVNVSEEACLIVSPCLAGNHFLYIMVCYQFDPVVPASCNSSVFLREHPGLKLTGGACRIALQDHYDLVSSVSVVMLCIHMLLCHCGSMYGAMLW